MNAITVGDDITIATVNQPSGDECGCVCAVKERQTDLAQDVLLTAPEGVGAVLHRDTQMSEPGILHRHVKLKPGRVGQTHVRSLS